MNLAALVAEQADHYEKKIAIYYQDHKIRYDELNLTANRIANSLLERGLEKGENVGIFLPNRPEFVQSFFGIVKSGGVAVMINTGLKSDEIEFILQNCRATRLITTDPYYKVVHEAQDNLPALREVFIVGDNVKEGLFSYDELLYGDENEPPIAIDKDDAAGIIYTSGTTGSPKGAVLTNGNYFANIQQIVKATGMNSQTRMMCILPLFHVMGMTFNVLAPFYAGGSIVLTRGFSAREFLPALSKFRVTAFAAVPTVFAILNEIPDRDKYDLSDLNLCISGAAPLDEETFKRFEALYKAKIVEGYGLSEATCAVCVNPIDGRRKVGSVGVPLPGIEVQVVDEENEPLEAFEIGEIIVRGPTVMKEYLNDEVATRLALREGNWLVTGDLGYFDDDGYYFITGRKKEMIIRGGENIYPKEIEKVLEADDRIDEAAVIGVPDPIWGEEVLAYIVPTAGAKLQPQDVIDLAKSKLADYKCPRRVKFVPKLPKSVTGKIRKALLFKYFLNEDGLED